MNEYLSGWFERHEAQVRALEHRIWARLETALNEHYACAETAAFLREQGFAPECFSLMGDGGEPNAIVARYGSGRPVIAILGEYDALPGLGQDCVSHKAPLEGPGHGCGHCQIISCAVAAASALKSAMEAEGLGGTLVFMATPAEESLQGKVRMAAEGYFDELDLCFAWHPCDMAPSFDDMVSAASTDVTFEFFGKSAHAAMQPWAGRSALDAAELMSVGVQYLREHITEDCKVHHSYLSAGTAPNVVPEYAAVRYLVRSNDAGSDEILERVTAVAEGAALMTGTTMKRRVKSHCCGSLPNHVLNEFCYRAVGKVEPIAYTEEEYRFAREVYENTTGKAAPGDNEALLPTATHPPEPIYIAGSSDVGDVSHIVPTLQVRGPGRVKGTPGHHWSVVAASGTSIGEKAAVYAAKLMSQAMYDALIEPGLAERCREEFHRCKAEKGIGPYRKFQEEN